VSIYRIFFPRYSRKRNIRHRIDQIRQRRFEIYDLSTLKKTDALIELGIALGMGREVVIIHKKGSPPPEAIRHLDRIEYEDLSHLTERLKKRMNL
jgi:hypothetical protein